MYHNNKNISKFVFCYKNIKLLSKDKLKDVFVILIYLKIIMTVYYIFTN